MHRVLVLALAVLVAGCAREDGEPSVPAHCKSAGGLVAAVEDRARVSDCFVKDSSTGSVVLLGASAVEAARRLGRESDAAGLGYLVGAARRGATRSQGIHHEIVRRLEQEAGSLSRSRAFEAGERAGRTSG